MAAACAPKAPPGKRPGPTVKKPTTTTTPATPPKPVATPEITRTNAKPSTADAMTPKRQASLRLVERGQTLMEQGQKEQAAAAFRDAVTVDGTNGIAYYYLASAKAAQGEKALALGLLDKAEALMGADPEWMLKINDLRASMGAPTHANPVNLPIDNAF